MSDHAGVESPSKPRVTIVVTPRERFGMAQKSLESVYETADIPFDLIYVDGGSPKHLSDWLKAIAPVKRFKLIQQDRFVSSNEARNLAVAASTSEFILFIDNDVICAEGWLSALVKAADETGADVVSPIICEGMPLHSCVHRTTGTFTRNRAEFFAAPHGERLLIDVMTHFKMPLEKIRGELRREETDACEFHCILVRRSILEKTGPFDENIRATKEYIDFSMCVLKVGGKLIFEPGALVTYVYPTSASPITREEMSYFLLRWSPLWQTQDLAHMQRKWGLTDDGELAEVRDIEYMRRRQFEGYIKPWIRKLPLVRRSYKLRKAAGWILRQYVDRKVRGLAKEYERQRTAHHRMLGVK